MYVCVYLYYGCAIMEKLYLNIVDNALQNYLNNDNYLDK